MATRAHTILENLITKIEAITPDEQSGPADKFRHAPGLDTDAAISRDRSFAIAPTGTILRDPRYISSTRPAVALLELELGVAYQNTRNATNRILKDSERLLDTIEAFQGDHNGELLEVEITAGQITPLDRTVIATYVLSIAYSLDLT